MKILLFSDNTNQLSLLTRILEFYDIDIIHFADREQIEKSILDYEYIAIILDLPNPTQEDMKYWRRLIDLTPRLVLLLSLDQTDVDRVLSGQQAVLHLSEPLIHLFKYVHLGRREKEKLIIDNDIETLAPGVYFDIARLCIKKNNEYFNLSTIEFKLLYFLKKNIGSMFTAEELIDYLELSGLSSLYVHIQKLRHKIEENPCNPHILVNQRGKGYKIIVQK